MCAHDGAAAARRLRTVGSRRGGLAAARLVVAQGTAIRDALRLRVGGAGRPVVRSVARAFTATHGRIDDAGTVVRGVPGAVARSVARNRGVDGGATVVHA